MEYKKAKLNIGGLVLILLTSICLVVSAGLSIALFRSNKTSSTKLDIEPIVLSGPTVKTYTANFNEEMIGKDILVNDITFSVMPSIGTNSLYLRASIKAVSNNIDVASSTELQDAFIPVNSGVFSWVKYKDYYYLYRGSEPAKLSITDLNEITFLEQGSLKVPDFIDNTFFINNDCSIEFTYETIDSSLIDASIASDVESVSSTPTTPQTHTVVFYNTNGEIISTLTNIPHGSSVVSSIPVDSAVLIPTGYDFVNWNTQIEGRGATLTTEKLSNIVKDLNVYPVVEKQSFTIDVIQVNHGLISPETTTVYYGDSLNLFFTPDDGYLVRDVIIDGDSQGGLNSYALMNISQDHIVTAVFEIRTYTVSVNYTGNGTVTPIYQTLQYGQNAQGIVITPDSGCYISDIIVDGISQGGSTLNNPITHQVNHVIKDIVVNIVFEDGIFDVIVTQIPNCSITESILNIPRGETRSFIVSPVTSPFPGYRIVKLIVDGVDTIVDVMPGESYTYSFENIQQNHTLTAVVEENIYNIHSSVNVPSTGSVSPATSSVNPGSDFTLTLTPNTGYEVERIVDNGTTIAIEPNATSYYIGNIQEHHTVVVFYKIKTISIYVAATSNGVVTQASVGLTSVVGPTLSKLLVATTYNNTVIASINPVAGCKISSITLTNLETEVETIIPVTAPAESPQTITFSPSSANPLTANYLLSVNFARHMFNLTILERSQSIAGGNNFEIVGTTGGMVEGDGQIAFNTAINLTINPNHGFEFVGYFTDAECTTPYTIPAVMPGEDITVYARFNRISYLLDIVEIYETLEGTYAVGNYGGIAYGGGWYIFGTPLGLPAPTPRNGFSFIDYYSDPNGTAGNEVAIAELYPSMPSEAVVCYAKFTRNTYSLFINPGEDGEYNNSSLSTEIVNLKYEQVYTIPQSFIEPINPYKVGHTFANWSLFDGVGEVDGNEFTVGAGNATILANYTINSYALTINPNGGSYLGNFLNTTITREYGQTYQLFTQPSNLNAPSSSYEFLNWEITTGEATNLNAEYVYTFNSDATVMANWDGVTYNLTIIEVFETTSNTYTIGIEGGTVDGDGDLIPNSAINITTRPATGFSFDGYYSDAQCENSIAIPSIMNVESMTCYALFTRNAYTITINNYYEEVDGSFTAGTTGGSLTSNAASIKYGCNTGLNATSTNGFSLAKSIDAIEILYINASFTSSVPYSTRPTTMPAGNLTYFVKFVRNKYKLTINPNGGTYKGKSETQIVEQKYQSTYNLDTVSRLGYEVVNWPGSVTNGTIAGTVYTFGLGNDTITAQWNAITYTLTINPSGGEYSSELSVNGTIGTSVSLGTLSKPGYAFINWSKSGAGTLNSSTSFTFGAGNATLTANYMTEYYNVTITPKFENVNGTSYSVGNDGGTATGGAIDVIYNTSINLGATANTGFVFSGYYSDNGLTTLISDDANYSFLVTESVNIYAKFTRLSYNLTIEPNSGLYNGNSSAITITKKFQQKLVIFTPTKTGYNFTGWSFSSGTGYFNGNQTEFTFTSSDASILANWSIKTAHIQLRNAYEVSTNIYTLGTSGGAVTLISATDWSGQDITHTININNIVVSYGTTITFGTNVVTGYQYNGCFRTLSKQTGETTYFKTSFVISFGVGEGSIVSSDIDYYARFGFEILTLTLNNNTTDGSSTDLTNITLSSALEEVVKPLPPEREGYDFIGWNSAQNGSGQYVGDLIGPLGNRFTRGTYNITNGVFSEFGEGDILYSRYIAVVGGQTYCLLNAGATTISCVAFDVGMAKYQAGDVGFVNNNNVLSYTPAADGYIVLHYNVSVGTSFGEGLILCHQQTIYSNIFGTSSNTAYAQWRLRQYYVSFYNLTQNFYQDDLSYEYDKSEIASYISSTGGISRVNGTIISTTPTAITSILVYHGVSENAITLTLNNYSNYYLSKVYQYNYLSGYYNSTAALDYSLVRFTNDNDSINLQYSISGGRGQKDITHYINSNQIICVLYRSPVLLLKNEKEGQAVNAQNYPTQYFPGLTFGSGYTTFKILDCQQAHLPIMEEGGNSYQFYYFSTGFGSSESGVAGTRYDLDNNYYYDLSTSNTEPLKLYATYLKQTSNWNSGGYGLSYINVPHGTTSLNRLETTHKHGLITKDAIRNAFGYLYECSYLFHSPSGSSTTKYITLPRGLTTIGDNAFSELIGLQGVSFPVATLRTIGVQAFSDTYELTYSKFRLPDTLTTIGSAFLSYSGLEKVNIGGSLTLPEYNSEGDLVSGLSLQAFNNATDLAYIIGSGNFSNNNRGILFSAGGNTLVRCPEAVTFDEGNYDFSTSLMDICDYAFYRCNNLTSITCDRTAAFGNYVFYGCEALKTVNATAFISITFGDYCFARCSALTNMDLWAFLGVMLGDSCLRDCSNLAFLEMTAGAKVAIGDDALSGCSRLSNIILRGLEENPDDSTYNLTIVGSASWLFYAGTDGNYATTGSPVTELHLNGKYSCDSPNFYDWILSDGITYNGDYTSGSNINGFSGTSIIGYKGTNVGTADAPLLVPNKLYMSGKAFVINSLKLLTTTPTSNSSYVQYLSISENITTVGSEGDNPPPVCGTNNSMVEDPQPTGNETLVSISFGTDTRIIYPNAFSNCKALTSITLSSRITSIGTNAFANCSLLSSLYIYNSSMSVGSECFAGTSSFLKIYIPGSISITNNAVGSFKNYSAIQPYLNILNGKGFASGATIYAQNNSSTAIASYDSAFLSFKLVFLIVIISQGGGTTNHSGYYMYGNGPWVDTSTVLVSYGSNHPFAMTPAIDNSYSCLYSSTQHIHGTYSITKYTSAYTYSYYSSNDIHLVWTKTIYCKIYTYNQIMGNLYRDGEVATDGSPIYSCSGSSGTYTFNNLNNHYVVIV